MIEIVGPLTPQQLLAQANLNLAEEAKKGNQSAQEALKVGIRVAMLEAESTPSTEIGVETDRRDSTAKS